MKRTKSKTPEQIYKDEQEKIRQHNALEEYMSRPGHAMPRTRRELLQAGVITTLGSLALPTMLQLISRQAFASEISDECKPLVLPTRNWVPYLQVYCGGGGALHTAALIRDKNRDLLPSYNTLGLGKTSNFNVKNEMGTVLAEKNGVYVSHMMQQLVAEAGPSALSKTTMVKFCVTSRDDRRAYDNLMGLANAIGYKGKMLPNLRSGTNKPKFAEKKADAVQAVMHIDGFLDSMAPAGALKQALNTEAKQTSMLRLVRNLNASQRRQLSSTSSAKALGQLVECASGKNIDISKVNRDTFDPRKNASVANIWGIQDVNDPKDDNLLRSAVAYNVISGQAGGGCIGLSGFDYHGNKGGRPYCNEVDADGGRTIGRALRTAEALNTPLFIHVSTDGSVAGNGSDETAPWGTDSGVRGSGFFLVFHPNGRIQANDDQIGHFKPESQTVDDDFIGSWRLDKCAMAIFANYLAINGLAGSIESIMPGYFTPAELAKVLKFG